MKTKLVGSHKQTLDRLARFIRKEKRRLSGPTPENPGHEDTVTAIGIRDKEPPCEVPKTTHPSGAESEEAVILPAVSGEEAAKHQVGSILNPPAAASPGAVREPSHDQISESTGKRMAPGGDMVAYSRQDVLSLVEREPNLVILSPRTGQVRPEVESVASSAAPKKAASEPTISCMPATETRDASMVVRPQLRRPRRRKYRKPPVSQRTLVDIPLSATLDQLSRLQELRKRCVRARHHGSLKYQAQKRLAELTYPTPTLVEDARGLEWKVLFWKPELLEAWYMLIEEILKTENESVFNLVFQEAGVWLCRLRVHFRGKGGDAE
jgi:hypothetical protein